MSQVTGHKSQVFSRNAMRFTRGAMLSGIVFWAVNSFAETVSSTELINKAKDYDGKTVVYQGEVIGEVMARGEYAWVNLNDGKNALGIWIRKDLVGQIANTGSYKVIGDTVEVTGVFHRSCLAHGGDLDIHAESLRLIENGNRVRQHLSSRRLKLAFGLGLTLIILWISKILIKPRKQK